MTEIVIIGGGLTGLSAASQLGDQAVVLERASKAGGLVRSLQLGNYWFDHVLHLLYFWDEETARLISGVMGDVLASCPPQAFVETAAATTRFPFQMHLGKLPRDLLINCLRDLASCAYGQKLAPPANYKEMLLQTFGESMCEEFFYPYNRKMWKRPLEELAPSGFQWNIERPEFESVLAGALDVSYDYYAYNAKGFYPRPAIGSKLRGMECISNALASRVHDLQCNVNVRAIDTERRIIEGEKNGETIKFQWQTACLSTLPLPDLIRLCSNVPDKLRDECAALTRNRVIMVYCALRGPRPDPHFGHWRYYTDETICFTRLISMTAFDPANAPKNGWSLMAEIPERGEEPVGDISDRIKTAIADARRLNVITEEHSIVETAVQVFDPAYVVFSLDNQSIIERARAWVREHGITPLGRYGRWEYSSMAQCMRDGFIWGRELAARLGQAPPTDFSWSKSIYEET